jgi:hypothetical protein
MYYTVTPCSSTPLLPLAFAPSFSLSPLFLSFSLSPPLTSSPYLSPFPSSSSCSFSTLLLPPKRQNNNIHPPHSLDINYSYGYSALALHDRSHTAFFSSPLQHDRVCLTALSRPSRVASRTPSLSSLPHYHQYHDHDSSTNPPPPPSLKLDLLDQISVPATSSFSIYL